ncbi:short transient receptor potential channel 2-like [Pygocentrus nattereri]|nr:short transient receptor potential channel 2-like [Pygocentrus nattereri]
MAPITIKHVVSFTSQDPKNCVENLCEHTGASKPWLCGKQDCGGVLKAELQLERASTIGFMDVGNYGSAFIQVDVGRSSWPLDHPYVTLLPTATLMSPADSRQGKGRQGVRMFKKADFLPQAAGESWDRLQVTCTQPFNKRSQFGLFFLRLRTAEEHTEEVSAHQEDTENQGTPDKIQSVREWLTSPAVQHTFFGRKTGENSPAGDQRNRGSLSRAERMVTAAQSTKRSIDIEPHNTKSKASTPQEHRRQSKTRQEQTTMMPTPKRSRLECENLSSRHGEISTPSKTVKKKEMSPFKHSPVKIPIQTPIQNIPDHPEPFESGCPICGVSFSPLYLPFHASSCLDSGSVGLLSDTETEIMPFSPSPPPFSTSRDELMVPCPLCSFRFPIDCIEQHASTCGDTVWVDSFFAIMENLTPEQWREIVNKKLRFPPELISAIQEGNMVMISGLLKTGDGIIRQLEESEDRQWREALNLSIRLGNEDTMVALLQGVKFDFRQIHEALLVAVDTNQPRIVKRLLDRLDQEKGNKMDVRSFSQAIFDHSIDDSQFAPGVTPLTLACQKDLYDIVNMLTQKGHIIPWPHKVSCSCLECRNGRQYDLLKFSLSRINTYRGLASRAYLSITSEDAMLSAFHLSRDLRKLSKKEPEFKPQYIALEELCQEFAVELLGMCRNQSEVTTILNSSGVDDDDSEDEFHDQAFEEGIPNLARLRLAVNYNQKQFVAHPICQQVLSSIWCGHLPGWRGSRTAWKLFVSLGIFITMPLLCLIYWIAPKSKVGKILKIPVIKFLLHSASYLWFLITLLGESLTMERYRDSFASRQPNILHNSLHMVWVAGFFWFECKEVWIEGLRSYFLDLWNCLDMMVLSMYLAAFTLRVVIMLKGHFLCLSPGTEEECVYFTQTLRDDWRQEDPQLIAEVLFAVTSMLSFTRLAYILPAQESLGTLQISMGKMIDDMIRFLFILMIIGTAFLCGINNIYVPYIVSPQLGRFNETFQFLFWTMFGVVNKEYVDMPDFIVAEFVGRILYGIFTLLIVIVLLNMLIAMITNSFQKIEDDADVEWKFARSKLYLSYFREGLTMPVPFNIIPSPKAFFYLVRGIFRRICCCCKFNSTPDYPPIASMSNGSMKDDGGVEEKMSYRQQVICALVQRYIESARREFEETKRKDVGNRVTELSKVVGRLHTEMKQIHQTLLDTEAAKMDPSEKSTSVLGKYIRGAKNNFRGFDSSGPSESRSTPLLVNVHEQDPGLEPDSVEQKDAGGDNVTEVNEEDASSDQTVVDMKNSVSGEEETGSGDGEGETEDETKKMEEGRVNEGTSEEFDMSEVNVVIERGTGIVSFMAKQIEERNNGQEISGFSGNKAASPTDSSDSHDTGFGSEELELSDNSP